MKKEELKKLIKEQLLESDGVSTVTLSSNTNKSVIIKGDASNEGYMVTNLSPNDITVEIKRVSVGTFITIK